MLLQSCDSPAPHSTVTKLGWITVPAYCYTRTSGHQAGEASTSHTLTTTNRTFSFKPEVTQCRKSYLSLSLSTDCDDTAVLWPGQASSRYTSVTLCLCQVLHNCSQISSCSPLPSTQAPDVAPVIKGHCLSVSSRFIL